MFYFNQSSVQKTSIEVLFSISWSQSFRLLDDWLIKFKCPWKIVVCWNTIRHFLANCLIPLNRPLLKNWLSKSSIVRLWVTNGSNLTIFSWKTTFVRTGLLFWNLLNDFTVKKLRVVHYAHLMCNWGILFDRSLFLMKVCKI